MTILEFDEDYEKARADRLIVSLYDKVRAGSDTALAAFIEPIGNDDRATKALFNLLDVSGPDCPDTMTQGVLRAEALAELVSAFDDYHREVFSQ